MYLIASRTHDTLIAFRKVKLNEFSKKIFKKSDPRIDRTNRWLVRAVVHFHYHCQSSYFVIYLHLK